MGIDVSQWRAAIGCFRKLRRLPANARRQYPYCSGEPPDIEEALIRHYRSEQIITWLVACVLADDIKKRKDFFNGLVCALLLAAAGIEPNPGPKTKGYERLTLWELVKNTPANDRLAISFAYLKDDLKVGDNVEWARVLRMQLTLENFIAAAPAPADPPTVQETSSSEPAGRRQENFNDLSVRSKRRRTQPMRASTSGGQLGFAAQMKLREEGQVQAAAVVQKAVESSPRTLQVIYAFVEDLKKKGIPVAQTSGPIPFTIEEAVAYHMQGKLSKAQYLFQREALSAHNCKVLPPYPSITEYKKNYCYPAGVIVTEKKASVRLQSLLDHTSTRLAKLQEEVFGSAVVKDTVKLQLISKCGFDASSRHSRYNQIWNEEGLDDSSILLTSLVPLVLHARHEATGASTVVWMNSRPNSTILCRPLQIEYTKETTQKIKDTNNALQSEIRDLEVSIIKVGDRVIECSHHVLTTMVDGKVSSAATNTSAQNCNVCKATPKQMNNIDQLRRREIDYAAFSYGLSVLHAYIRFLEYLLHVAYRLDVKKSYQEYTKEEKASMAARQKLIQERFKNETGLLLDRPSTSGGNTNTGNNSRRFFDDPVKAAEITGLDLDILIRCKIILKTLACGYAIDTDSFHKFAVETARMLVRTYSWYYMPASVHTVLIHGADFMSTFPVPIGMLSEESSESCNKDMRYLREHHTRKNSRDSEMFDLFHGLMARSDPLVASYRKKPKPRSSISGDIAKLLVAPSADGFASGTILPGIVESDDSDIDDNLD